MTITLAAAPPPAPDERRDIEVEQLKRQIEALKRYVIMYGEMVRRFAIEKDRANAAEAEIAAVWRANNDGEPGFSNGVTHAIKLLADAVGCSEWRIREGSEDRDQDIAATIMGVLAGARLYDDETGQWGRLSSTPTPDADRVEALRVAADLAPDLERLVAYLGDGSEVVPASIVSRVRQGVSTLRAALDGASPVEG